MTKAEMKRKVDTATSLIYKSDCATCEHKSMHFATCDAFPNGIPEQLLSGELNHRTPFIGDHGIMYEPVKKGD